MTDIDQSRATPDANPPPVVSQQGPYDAPFAVNISFPESIVIKMVDASALNDYEFGLFISSLFCSTFVGFLVAHFQTTGDSTFFIVSCICGLCAVAFFCWAIAKRRKMVARSRAFKLKTSGVEETKTG